MTEEVLVALSGVSHLYDGKAALQSTNLSLQVGGTTAVVGPDGVGKSTLLSLIAGARQLQKGTLTVLGMNMAKADQRAIAAERIAFMPQGLGRNLYPTLSVAENIDFHGRLFGQSAAERADRIGRLMRSIGLYAFRDRAAGDLSGGMKQKLSLCCALVHDPDLLILDEPTTGIDPLSRRQFWALIEGLLKERPGMSVIVSTGYMEEAEIFDRIVALNDGRILANGVPADIIGADPDLETAFVRLSTGSASKPLVIPPLKHSDGPPAIVARNLTRRFGEFIAVDHVSFTIAKGEIFGFLGSNGCGKSTTMKVMVGLLVASEGEADILGKPVNAHDLSQRLKLGYMSQAFSLYEELTVRGNLALHAELYQMDLAEARTRIDASLQAFDLDSVADTFPGDLPLGVRQRLQLAASCLHRPDILILDEPTSGVDPVARDLFWRTIVRLSREDGVTVFISTHFMNEAARCDRISLMDAGKVLALGPPGDLMAQKHRAKLEDAFVDFLEAAQGARKTTEPAPERVPVLPAAVHARPSAAGRSVGRMLAFARREMVELVRDRVRLCFSLMAPLLLLTVFAYGISFDVDHLSYAVLDRDQSAQSRSLIQAFEGSSTFKAERPLVSDADMTARLRAGALRMAVEIPPGFGRDYLAGRKPELGLFIDTAAPYFGETVSDYGLGVLSAYALDDYRREQGVRPETNPAGVQIRLRYNQDFKSVFAISPGLIMFLMAIIPAMMTALGVVREIELGSILNLYGSPASVPEYLMGKQLPYIGVSFIAYLGLLCIVQFYFGVPIKGSIIAILVGGVAYLFSTTAFGLLLSSLFTSQIAVMAAAAIFTIIPALNFSGFLYPVSEIEGLGWWIAQIFPGTWFQRVSLGAITKGIGFSELAPSILALIAIGSAEIGLACAFLKKQEA